MPTVITRILFAIFVGVFFAGTAIADFSQSDLEGKWHGHGLYVGNWHAWYHSTMTVDASGNGTESWVLSNGNADKTQISEMNISRKGIISSPDKDSLHGSLTMDKNIMALTGTYPQDDDGMYLLMIYIKAGASFTQSDLEGTWYGHSLISGKDPGWEYSTLVLDNQGNATYSSVDSEGDQETENAAGKLSISGQGIISLPGTSAFHGVLSPQKNIFVAVETGDEGEFMLHVFVRGGGEFDEFDWARTKWYGHMVFSGAWEAWMYETLVHDRYVNGYGICFMPNSESYSYIVESDNFSNEGILESPSTPGHGVVSNDRNIMVYTDTYTYGDDNDYYLLAVYTLAGQEFNDSDIIADIKANGKDGLVSINSAENLSLTIELSPKAFSGDNADWWLVADTPYGWFHYRPENHSWSPQIKCSYQGPLFNLAEFSVLKGPLPPGTYNFYFGFDALKNGNLDMNQILFDGVTVDIKDPSY